MGREVKVIIGKEKYTTTINIEPHQIIADEPTDLGGQDLGPDPLELLLSSLGACKAMTVRMYADRKEWALESVEIALSVGEQKSEHQETTFINCHIKFIGDLDDKQRQRLLMIADRCPIHKKLSNPIVIDNNLI